MAVIINQLEVVSEPPADDPPAAPATPPAPAGAPRLTPQDLDDVARHRAERQARVAAH